MPVIKPKVSTYVSLSLILLILISGLVYILRDFAYKGSFGIWFYLTACTLITLVVLMLLVKMLAGFRFITAARDQIIVKLPLRGYSKSYPISQILAWEEEIVIANKKEFRQVTIAFTDKQSISVSNHEHDAYKDLVAYLVKKAGRQRVKGKQ
ncbi:hypothetical protein LZF95_09280 [Algoriphagus sp. AGSA1]|uniref:hypothetical protein n=1 Tax=Algoriphagus sp. AGSA1 TaxID=2907213 RepID=UPI001F34786E|nr:hypothetical protein [Algoriphagus sp. AGSA1]MCE7054863.1 hypothetical protein [Algoriphagus sp. AGSA1]